MMLFVSMKKLKTFEKKFGVFRTIKLFCVDFPQSDIVILRSSHKWDKLIGEDHLIIVNFNRMGIIYMRYCR